jgi:hypothetical protein
MGSSIMPAVHFSPVETVIEPQVPIEPIQPLGDKK